ncbi:MAG: hypothetical protein OEU26_22500 [Candidatus Tectomicrobia bacterium]|nr:hypothetical protein [Candidatus Tectomicrobia bacterium]
MPDMTAKDALLRAAGFPDHGADVGAYDKILQFVDWKRAEQMGVQRYNLSNEDDHWRLLLNIGLNRNAVERVVDPSIRTIVTRLLKFNLSLITLESCSGHPGLGEETGYLTMCFLNPGEGKEFTHECWLRDLHVLGCPMTPNRIIRMSVERSLDNRVPVTIRMVPGPQGDLVACWTSFTEAIDTFDGEGVSSPNPAFERADSAGIAGVAEEFLTLLKAHK